MDAARLSWGKSGNALALAGLVAVVGNNVATALPAVALSAVAAGTGGFMVLGADSSDGTGGSVSGGGDVNGDGIDDVILGAPGDDTIGFNSGAAFVVFGKTSGAPDPIASLEVSGRGFAIVGEAAINGYAGNSVSMAGDVNGDGLGDLIVGAPFLNANAGRAYVVFGKTSSTPVFLSAVTAGGGGFRIDAYGAGEYTGFTVAGVGDVNGDGLSDVAVGAPGGDFVLRTDNGIIYVVHGKTDTTTVALSSILSTGGGFAIVGEATNDVAGQAISGAGDVNGDGLMDVVVGLGGKDVTAGVDGGRTYVVFGKTATGVSGVADLLVVNNGTGGFAIDGEQVLSQSGSSVSGAGDANGDGLADVVLAARAFDASGGRTDAGRVYVVFGKSSGTRVQLSAVSASATEGYPITGESINDQIGTSVSAAGDVNGDGRCDIVIGAPLADVGGGFTGRSYVVFGRGPGFGTELSGLTAGTDGFVIGTPPYGNGAANSVCAAGDVDRDGLADLIVGHSIASPLGGFDAGVAYVVHSPLALPPANTVALTRHIPQGNYPDVGFGTHRFGSDRTLHNDLAIRVDFDGGQGTGPNNSSPTDVALQRTDVNITNLLSPPKLIDALWVFNAHRTGWTNVRVTLTIDPLQIAGIVPGDLMVYRAAAPSGPWSPLTNVSYDSAKREISADTTLATGYFAVGQPGPANDNFANSFPIDLTPLVGVTTYATREAGEPAHFSGSGGVSGSLWYTYTQPTTGNVTFQTCGGSTNFDTIIAAYVGGSVDGLAEVTSNDDACGTGSSITFNAIGTQPYHIAVTGFNSATGTFTLSRTESPATPPTVVSIVRSYPNPTSAQAPGWNVTFSEPVGASFTEADLNITNTVAGRSVSGVVIIPLFNGVGYFVQLVLDQDGGTGQLGFSIPAGAVTDLFGNVSTTGASQVPYDLQPCSGGGLAGDINKDSVVNVADVTLLSNFIVNGGPPLP